MPQYAGLRIEWPSQNKRFKITIYYNQIPLATSGNENAGRTRMDRNGETIVRIHKFNSGVFQIRVMS